MEKQAMLMSKEKNIMTKKTSPNSEVFIAAVSRALQSLLNETDYRQAKLWSYRLALRV